MFTGIIEDIGKVTRLTPEGSNLHIEIESRLATELKIDQSISHNGACLTVVDLSPQGYTVTAIEETLLKTNLDNLKVGDPVNLERAMILGARLDGHLVQGHVDQTGICTKIKEEEGSWRFYFKYDSVLNNITIEKGSITINGVSLTVVDSEKDGFSVAIIPYTFEHTTFKNLKIGDTVNLEFDLIGKYVSRITSLKT
ncbi:MAG: riboflavin synthase [Cytophagaceae bacterium]|nr:riboflavin synthase [Cytophagaceae bacterium]|tara:strand:+ start:18748 stop:19338 length:591 start_codon:yes stop_codon:yes gene_type:complete